MLAIFAVSAIAINHNLLGPLASGHDCRQICFRVVMVKLKSPGNVPLLIMFIVAGIDENDRVHLEPGILEKLFGLRAIHDLEPLFLQPLNDGVQDRGRVGITN